MITVKKTSPFDEKASVLIDELDRYQAPLYPSESNHLDERATLASESCLFVGAFDGENICGISAVKKFKDYGELKRFFVLPDFRSRGVAKLMIDHLENYLMRNGIYKSRLETGIHQKEAIRFYEKHGYKSISAFGDYKEDPLSLFMEKDLIALFADSN
jgi:putative acetyltransferase